MQNKTKEDLFMANDTNADESYVYFGHRGSKVHDAAFVLRPGVSAEKVAKYLERRVVWISTSQKG